MFLMFSKTELAPSFGTVFSEQVEVSGSHASFKCLALGQPIPTIKWKIDGIQVTNTRRYNIQSLMTPDGKGSISIFNIQSLTTKVSVSHSEQLTHITDLLQDGGSYECIASNSAGTVSHKSRVNIIGPPGIKYIENMTAIQGDTFTLDCPYYGYPIDEVYFTKGKVILIFSESAMLNL
jgi:down syndrome cell adhesion molecule-like protein CG42256